MPRGLIWVVVALLLAGNRAALATQWRGSTELTFQTQEAKGDRTDFWRYFLNVTAEDRMFYRNRILLGLRLEARTFGTGQEKELRPRFDLEITGSGYVFTGLYAPLKRKFSGILEQRERQYNLSLAMFPQNFPVTTLTWNRFTRSVDNVPNDRRDVYTMTLDYARGVWRGQGRLLHQNRGFTGTMTNELLTSVLANNIVSVTRRYWNTTLRYQLDHTERRLASGSEDNATAHVLSGQARVVPNRRLVLALDADSRFASSERDTIGQATENYLVSGHINYRPWQPLEFAAVRYYASNTLVDDLQQVRSYTQLQGAIGGRFLSALLGALTVTRTWNHKADDLGRENDAVYARLAGDLFARTSLSVEGSYAHRHFGAFPVTTVRSATLRSHILRDSRFQIQYGAQGSSNTVKLWSIERQNINANWQQNFGGQTYLTLGWNHVQERNITDAWRTVWYVTGSVGIRKWALLSGQYNRATEIVVPTSPVEPTESPTRSELQLTIYPEQRWIWTANWYQSRNAVGEIVTFWGGSLRYRL